MYSIISQNENVLLRNCEIKWLEESKKRYSNPSLSLFTSMVFGFAKHLPYIE